MAISPQTFFDFNRLRVLIVGDVMLDRYLFGHSNRVSPEAPVPLVDVEKKEDRLGGAANVALNIKALGATPILCSVLGKDEEAEIFYRLMKEADINASGLVQSAERKTTTKTRVLVKNQQLLRFDAEDRHSLSTVEEKLFLEKITKILQQQKIDVLVFQDYNKGVLSLPIIRELLMLAIRLDIPTAVDPKKKNFFEYRCATLFKPNLKEVRDSLAWNDLKVSKKMLGEASQKITQKLSNKYTMITLSEKGIYVNTPNGDAIYPTQPRRIADVCGAGDTVISIAALGIALGLEMEDIATLSNFAGGQVCEKAGVVPVNKETLIAEYKKMYDVRNTM